MPSTGMMGKVDSLIQRAQHLACIRRPPLDFTGASRADVIEMIKEEIIELMKGGTLSPSCKTCQKISFFQPLAHERSFIYNRFEERGPSFSWEAKQPHISQFDTTGQR